MTKTSLTEDDIYMALNDRIAYLTVEMGFSERLAGRSSITYQGLRARVEELKYFRDIILREIKG